MMAAKDRNLDFVAWKTDFTFANGWRVTDVARAFLEKSSVAQVSF